MTKQLIDILHKKAKQGPIVGYFGYGSLVNKNTLRTEYIATIPATLKGWQRMWDTPSGDDFDGQSVSLLTVRPNQSKSTKGVVVFDWAENLPLVDAREHNYHRRTINTKELGFENLFDASSHSFYVYEAIENKTLEDERPPLLHSYLDAVLQGFHDVYGSDGIHEFMATTENFHTPILNDRNQPQYPRSVQLNEEQRALIDLILASKADISFIA
jgi:hypothetical protein